MTGHPLAGGTLDLAQVNTVANRLTVPGGAFKPDQDIVPRQGPMRVFNGVNLALVGPTVQAFVSTTQYTLAFWMRRAAANDPIYLSQGTTEYVEWLFFSDGRLYLQTTSASSAIDNACNDGRLHHVVIAYNGNGALGGDRTHVFFDGIRQTLSIDGGYPASLPATDTVFNIGRWIRTGPSYANGNLSDVWIWDRTLSDAEARGLWHLPTRWDLYARPSTRVFFDIAAAPAGPARFLLMRH
jgi:hypothetical protein